MQYNCSIEECDIVDKKKGEEFRKKREQWIEWLYGEDIHSISHQISSLLWDYGIFLIVNELRKAAEDNPNPDIKFNGPVLNLFDAGFATMQAIGIRRLTDKPKKDKKREQKEAVISLPKLIKDIKNNIDLLTRENYVCYNDLPYEHEDVYNKWISSIQQNSNGATTGALPMDGRGAFDTSRICHEKFDKLAKVQPKMRQRNDTINIEFLNILENEIEKCKNVRKFADKFIAHAAAPENRITLNDDERNITLDRLKRCHIIIKQVASFISGPILFESNIGDLPVPQYDHLKNLDKRWGTKEDLVKVRKRWDEFSKEVESWNSSSLWQSMTDIPNTAT